MGTLALTLVAWSLAAADPAPAPAATDVVEVKPVVVSARVLEITATAPRDATVYGPFRPALGSFEVIAPRPGTVKTEGAMRTETWRFEILPLRLGVEKVPAIQIPYRLADGSEGVVLPMLESLPRGSLAPANPVPG